MRKQRILAALLAFALVLSLVPAVQITGFADAVTDVTGTDVIQLPITIRDVHQDNILMESNKPNNVRGLTTTDLDSTTRAPKYSTSTINTVAGYFDEDDEIEAINDNGNLEELLYARWRAGGNTNNARNQAWRSTNWTPVDNLEDATTARAAADWMLRHLFVDGTYTYNGNTYDYSKTYANYETLTLIPTTANDGTVEYYSYASKGTNTVFDKTNKTIYNVDEPINNVSVSLDRGGWYPINNLVFGNEGNDYNYHTTTQGSGQFVYHENEELFFEFVGDDDVYLYINGKLVIDDGGTHTEQTSRVELEKSVNSGDEVAQYTDIVGKDTDGDGTVTWAEYLGLEEGKIYSFDFFQMERKKIDSNFAIKTNINVVDSSAVPAKKAYQNGQELVYGSFVPQNSEVTYGFELSNNGESTVTNLTFVDNLLGVELYYTGSDKTTVISTPTSSNTYSELSYEIYTSTGTVKSGTLTAELLGSLLKEGIDPGETIAIRGFKYNVGIATTILNTVTTTAEGKYNNSSDNRVITGTAKMRLRTLDIANKTFVLDYANGTTLTFSNDEVFGVEKSDKTELELLSGTGITVKDDESSSTVTLSDTVNNVKLDRENGTYGTMKLKLPADAVEGSLDYYLTYTPNRILNGIDAYTIQIQVDTVTTYSDNTQETGSNILNKNISIIPANNVYYEDTFVDTTKVTDEAADTSVQIVYNGTSGSPSYNESEYVGEDVDNNPDTTNNAVHGWVTSLADDLQYSDGSATKMTTGATATFTFTGTGVDIYSYTDMTTGIVTAVISGGPTGATTTKYLMVDNLAVSGNYYQIPTLFWNDLPYGTYTVTLVVNSAKAVEEIDKDGGIVYSDTEKRTTYFLDGIRVYNPLGNTVSGSIANAYDPDGSLSATQIKTVFKSVNDLLAETDNSENASAAFIDLVYTKTALEVKQNADNGRYYYVLNDEVFYLSEGTYGSDVYTGTDGKSYIDVVTSSEVAAKDYYSSDVYNTYGPKNEVYLAPGQSIVFAVDSGATEYYVGLKSLTGEAVAALSNGATVAQAGISHSTDLYYKVIPNNGYITITNRDTEAPVDGATTPILAITKLQMVGASNGTFKLRTVNAEEAVAEVNAFSLRSTVAYTAEPEKEEEVQPEQPVVPDEPEVPDIEVDIENPTEPEQKPQQNNQKEQLKQLVNLLFNKIFSWFGR